MARHVRVNMYLVYMGLVRIGHIGNMINIDLMKNDRRNLDDELCSVGLIFYYKAGVTMAHPPSPPPNLATSITIQTSFTSF